jgi:hypothetical protein
MKKLWVLRYLTLFLFEGSCLACDQYFCDGLPAVRQGKETVGYNIVKTMITNGSYTVTCERRGDKSEAIHQLMDDKVRNRSPLEIYVCPRKNRSFRSWRDSKGRYLMTPHPGKSDCFCIVESDADFDSRLILCR